MPPLDVRIVVQLHEMPHWKDEGGHSQAGLDNEVTIQDSDIQAPEDFLAHLLGLIFVYSGECLWVPAAPPIGQLAYRKGAKHHGVKVLGHAVGLGIQQVAWATQQVQNSGVSSADLLQFQIFLFVSEEGVKVDGRPRCCRRDLPSSVLLGDVSFLVPVVAEMHGEPEHAPHEDCVVTHAGPIHHPGVDIMRVGTHYNITEHPVCCQHHIRVTIEGIQVVLVVGYGSIQSG